MSGSDPVCTDCQDPLLGRRKWFLEGARQGEAAARQVDEARRRRIGVVGAETRIKAALRFAKTRSAVLVCIYASPQRCAGPSA